MNKLSLLSVMGFLSISLTTKAQIVLEALEGGGYLKNDISMTSSCGTFEINNTDLYVNVNNNKINFNDIKLGNGYIEAKGVRYNHTNQYPISASGFSFANWFRRPDGSRPPTHYAVELTLIWDWNNDFWYFRVIEMDPPIPVGRDMPIFTCVMTKQVE